MPANTWLPEHELRVYSTEYERTGFQGGLQRYPCAISPEFNSELALDSGRTIDVPSYFISGSSDWGHYQRPGALEAMQSSACTDMRGCTLVEGAGHWVQQEQPAAVADQVLNFLRDIFFFKKKKKKKKKRGVEILDLIRRTASAQVDPFCE